MRTCSVPGLAAARVACSALRIRLRITCWISSRLTMISGSSAAYCSSSDDLAGPQIGGAPGQRRADDLVEVLDRSIERRLARERQQVPDDLRGALAGDLDLLRDRGASAADPPRRSSARGCPSRPAAGCSARARRRPPAGRRPTAARCGSTARGGGAPRRCRARPRRNASTLPRAVPQRDHGGARPGSSIRRRACASPCRATCRRRAPPTGCPRPRSCRCAIRSRGRLVRSSSRVQFIARQNASLAWRQRPSAVMTRIRSFACSITCASSRIVAPACWSSARSAAMRATSSGSTEMIVIAVDRSRKPLNASSGAMRRRP